MVYNRKGKVSIILDAIQDWVGIDEGSLEGTVRSQFLIRKKAILLYSQGYNDKKIKEQTGLSGNYVYRMITERCGKIHQDGLYYGWRGIIPNKNIKDYKRIKNINNNEDGRGHVGSLTFIFDIHPLLKERFIKRILSIPSHNCIEETNKSKRSHWNWLIKELRKLEYEKNFKWPFNTSHYGYITICKYVEKVLLENPYKAGQIWGKDIVQKQKTGDGVDRPNKQIYERVEMDAHKLDGRFCILVPDLTGELVAKIIHRIWVIVIIDICSRAVLAYHLSFEREINQNDVLRTIKKALSNWQPRPIMMSNIKFIDGAGFPSYILPSLTGACWDETSVDGAMAENSKKIQNVLQEVVGSQLISPRSPEISFSKRCNKDDRPFIETFFRQLTVKGFQRLANTTGKDHKSKQGRDPEKIALAAEFQVEYAEELLEVLIANYNATPHSSLNYRSPLDFLRSAINRPNIKLRYASFEDIQNILSFRKKCKVNGNLKTGRSPFIHFEGARYTNEILKQRYDLIGQHIWVINHLEDDARIAMASTLQGDSLGVIRASPPWHKLPHSLAIRKTINSAIHRKIIHLSTQNDAVEEFLNFCENHKKMPVHPAYLEARRILVEQAEENVGKSMLEIEKMKFINDSNSVFNENYESSQIESQIPEKNNLNNLKLVKLKDYGKERNVEQLNLPITNLPIRKKVRNK